VKGSGRVILSPLTRRSIQPKSSDTIKTPAYNESTQDLPDTLFFVKQYNLVVVIADGWDVTLESAIPTRIFTVRWIRNAKTEVSASDIARTACAPGGIVQPLAFDGKTPPFVSFWSLYSGYRRWWISSIAGGKVNQHTKTKERLSDIAHHHLVKYRYYFS
jgi:hypothetical protein